MRLFSWLIALLLMTSQASVTTREYLTANRDLYIGNAGNDSNDCLSAATLCAHWQRIVDLAYGSYDLGIGWNVTAHVVGASQVFAESASISGAQVGLGLISFVGSPSNPADVVWGVPATNSVTLTVANGAALTMDGFQLQAASTSSMLNVANSAVVNLSDFIVNVGELAFDVNFSGVLNTNGSCKITAGGNAFAHIHDRGYLNMSNSSCTLIGTWSYVDYFLGCSEAAVIRMATMVFNVSGATIGGAKALIHQGCTVGAPLTYTNGTGTHTQTANSFFPGASNSATVTATGIFNDSFGP